MPLGHFMPPPQDLLAQNSQLLYVTLGFLLLFGIVARAATAERRRVRGTGLLYGFGLTLLLIARLADWMDWTALESTHVAGLMLATMALIGVISLLIFDVLLPLVHLPLPRIVRDLCVALGYITTALWMLHSSGMSPSNLITTSALLTAVIAFSLQDSLANIMGGLAVQLERTIEPGDWIRFDQIEGRVKEVRWRHTAIETRNWDTVLVPNSVLMKSQVTLLGRRTGQPVQHRMWIYFNVDFRYPPSQVISLVEGALRAAETIEGMSKDPPPNCIAYDFKDSYVQYAVRYWLNDLAIDDPTSSRVRVRIYFALKRAGIPLSLPAYSVFNTQDDTAHKSQHEQSEFGRRLEALRGVEIFHSLTEDELRKLAPRLNFAPFAAGEAMTRQGAKAHWLYIITRGSGEVIVMGDDHQRRRVATLATGDFFGEIGLMLGIPRTATVRALEDTECYRLEQDMFRDILHNRPEIAEHISHAMARRRVELEAVKENLDAETHRRRLEHAQQDIIAKISNFFGLSHAAGAGN